MQFVKRYPTLWTVAMLAVFPFTVLAQPPKTTPGAHPGRALGGAMITTPRSMNRSAHIRTTVPYTSSFRHYGHHHKHHNRRSIWIVGSVGSYWPYPYYYGSYGISPYYDPYLSTIQTENQQLRRQIDRLLDDRQKQQDDAAVRIKVPPRNRKLPAQQAQDRKRELQERANQYIVAGVRLFDSGTYHRARERFREAVRLAGDDPSPHFYLAQANFATRHYAVAVQSIKNGLKANPDWLEVDFDMSTLYGNDNDLPEQMAHLASQLQTNPLDRDALFLLGYELFVTGEKEKARVLLEQAARLEPDDAHLKPFFDYFAKLEGGVLAGVPELSVEEDTAAAKPAIVPKQFPGITLPDETQ